MNPHKALKAACIAVGGQRALARVLNLKSQGTVSYWLSVKRVPAERVLAIEAATMGKVTRFELRPDIYPPTNPQSVAGGLPRPQGWH